MVEEMKSESVHAIIRFDGDAVQGKYMDVNHLAPSLLALVDLVKIVNLAQNGKNKPVRVLVNADLEQNCFELNFELLQSTWDAAKSLLSNDNVTALKEIAEWIGLIGKGSGVAGVAGITLYALIKKFQNKKIIKSEKEAGGTLAVTTTDDQGKTMVFKEIPVQIMKIYQNLPARQAAIAVLNPLKEDGYEKIEFYEKNNAPHMTISKNDVVDYYQTPLEDGQKLKIETLNAVVGIKKVVYDGTSKWTIVYENRSQSVSITDNEWLKEFQNNRLDVPPTPKSKLKVELEKTSILDEEGVVLADPTYKITKVLVVEPPLIPPELF